MSLFTIYRNVPILIDGAHALGSLDLQLSRFCPDFYASNCHKWFCCPKGSAFLYVKEDRQPHTRPLVISHGFGSGFNSEFIWTGKILYLMRILSIIEDRLPMCQVVNLTCFSFPFCKMHSKIRILLCRLR